MIEKPAITVLMPVFNGEQHLAEAIESVLAQTYKNFEFLIIDDGSTDGSAAIIASFNDSRIRYIKNEVNIGLPKTLNKGLRLANADFIARMDCDDICFRERLERQYKYLINHYDIAVCGTYIKTIGNEQKEEVWKYTLEPCMLKCRLLFDTQFAHPSVMLRKNLLIHHNLWYKEEHAAWSQNKYAGAEDWGLWLDCSIKLAMANIPEVLLLYRMDSAEQKNNKRENVRLNIIEDFFRTTSIPYTASEVALHNHIGLGYPHLKIEDLNHTYKWLDKLRYFNSITHLYPEKAFQLVLGERWFQACTASTSMGLKTLYLYIKNQDLFLIGASFNDFFKLVIKCILRWKLS